MTHMQKPPPGQGFLYGEASNQPVFAGSNIHQQLQQDNIYKVYTNNSNHFHANKGSLRIRGRFFVGVFVLVATASSIYGQAGLSSRCL